MHGPDPLGPSPVVQLAHEVPDLERAARQMAALGAGPFHRVVHPPLAHAVDGTGRPTNFDHMSAYGQWGGIQVELIQLHSAVDDPELRRGPGLHHVARFCTDIVATSAALAERGAPAVLSARTASGVRFHLHRLPGLGHLLEIYERSPAVERVYRAVAEAAADWDGTRPLRDLTLS